MENSKIQIDITPIEELIGRHLTDEEKIRICESYNKNNGFIDPNYIHSELDSFKELSCLTIELSKNRMIEVHESNIIFHFKNPSYHSFRLSVGHLQKAIENYVEENFDIKAAISYPFVFKGSDHPSFGIEINSQDEISIFKKSEIELDSNPSSNKLGS